jgi:hypothetical protein
MHSTQDFTSDMVSERPDVFMFGEWIPGRKVSFRSELVTLFENHDMPRLQSLGANEAMLRWRSS